MDVYINNFINTKSYRKFEDISNKNSIVQWYCCDCGQSYGTIIYHDHIVDLLNKEDDVSRLKYYSSIIYNHPSLNSNYQLLSSLTPDFSERKFFDDEDSEYFGMQRSNSINLPINNQKHDSKSEKLSEFNTSLSHRNSICTEENNNSSISQGSPSNQNDFDHVQSCYNDTEETINLNSPVENGPPYNDDNDKKDPNQYLISTPERIDRVFEPRLNPMDDSLINDKLELAKLYFKSKKYHEALQIYDSLVRLLKSLKPSDIIAARLAYNLPDPHEPYIGKLHHPKLITALDNRAATYEKLGESLKSVRDSKFILSINPVELKGYLRLGKLYLKSNDLLAAFKNYQLGSYTLSKFREKYPKYPISEALYESFKQNYQHVKSLRKSERSLQGHISEQFTVKRQRKCTDPFLYLSQDILYVIFGLLSLKQILSCHLICKNWCTNLRQMIYLYLDKLELKTRIKYKEFLNGVKLFSKVKGNLINLRVNKTANGEFIRIFDNIVKSNFKLRVFENYNLMQFNELILRIDKMKFNCNFRHLNTLKLVLNSNPSVELLNLFPNLQNMELIIMSNQEQLNMKLLAQVVNKQAYKKLTIPKEQYENLSSMVLISNISANNTFPYIHMTFNLTKLILANFDFLNVQHIFGNFLSYCHNLEILLLENNKNLSFKDFFNNLVNYKSNFRLKKFTFREYLISNSCNLQEFEPSDFENFQDIQSLDIYCCSLSNNGLVKLLKHCTYISTLVLGSSNYIYFKNESISTRFTRLNLYDILSKLPLLKNLTLVDLNLDNLSLSYFEKDFKKLNLRLDSLDVSFNLNINGIGLLSLLSDRWTSQLTIDGVYINPDTLKLIESRGIQIQNDHMKTRWRQYGVNSFILSH